jgi:signal transduction histidine kinase
VSFDAGHWPGLSLPTDLADHVYRVAQEALGNAVRHSGASRIAIRLAARGEMLELAVCDNGRGLGERALHGEGLGRRIMNYRAQAIGGGVEWRQAGSGGTEVLLQVPLAELQPA